jgi:hypothetical protein
MWLILLLPVAFLVSFRTTTLHHRPFRPSHPVDLRCAHEPGPLERACSLELRGPGGRTSEARYSR